MDGLHHRLYPVHLPLVFDGRLPPQAGEDGLHTGSRFHLKKDFGGEVRQVGKGEDGVVPDGSSCPQQAVPIAGDRKLPRFEAVAPHRRL